jgi:hypothetical protein
MPYIYFTFQLSPWFVISRSKLRFPHPSLSTLMANLSHIKTSSYSPSNLDSASFTWFSHLYFILLDCQRKVLAVIASLTYGLPKNSE